MSMVAPLVDRRTRADVAAQVRAALAEQYPGWPDQGGAGNGLVEVFARYASLVIERINGVPDCSRALFLRQLGGVPLAPRPATVPLTFTLAPGGSIAGVIPRGTQVAAAPLPGSTQPVIFETDNELVATAAELDRMFVSSPGDDRYADLSARLSEPSATLMSVYSATSPLEHCLYVGSVGFFGLRHLDRLSISFDIEESSDVSKGELRWEMWSGAQGVPLVPEVDGTAAFRQSGDVTFRDLPAFGGCDVNGLQMHWLRCHWLKPVSRPVVARTITLEREVASTGLRLDMAFLNNTKLDLTKDFYPLGDHPRFGDVFYAMNEEASSLPGAKVTLEISMTNPAVGESDVPVPRVNATGNARVAWEYWNGKEWLLLGEMSSSSRTGTPGVDAFLDGTQAFTASGEVVFTLPAEIQPTTVGGITGSWLRARLTANGYGEEAGYNTTEIKQGVPAYVYRPSSVVAPVLKRCEIGYKLSETARYPDAVLARNNFAFEDISSSLRGTVEDAELFRASSDTEPAVYLGFRPPFGLGMPTTPVSVYFGFEGAAPFADSSESAQMQRTAWQFWDGSGWVQFGVVDETEGFSYSGRVTFLVPPAAKSCEQFGSTRFWLRVPWLGGSRDLTAPLRFVLLNTVSASQTVTLEGEVLGSSTGRPGQVFTASRHPVLEGEVLEVRALQRTMTTGTQEPWMPWYGVPSFHSSGPLDTHYVLDRLSGKVSFGDGRRGLVPPVGTANIRFARYSTGGGTAGNVGAGTIVQLKTSIPYVKSVVNVVATCGGADAETTPAMLERAPRSFRHRSRAVTVEDYEDLAKLASPDVARSLCVPSANLALDPDAKRTRPGYVSLLIVPLAEGPKPLPSDNLLRRVASYVEARQSPTVQLVVTRPEYVSFDVVAEIGVVRLEGVTELEAGARERLLRFLHPLRGGFDEKGWDFGRYPQRSDLLSMLSSLRGVDHVRSLQIQAKEERPGAATTSTFLASAGDIQLRFTLV